MRLTIKLWGMFVAKLSLEINSVISFKKSYSIKVLSNILFKMSASLLLLLQHAKCTLSERFFVCKLYDKGPFMVVVYHRSSTKPTTVEFLHQIHTV